VLVESSGFGANPAEVSAKEGYGYAFEEVSEGAEGREPLSVDGQVVSAGFD